MSTLLRLYPRAWRDRYGDELIALLDEHPATLVDHFDLIRGALDARLHPQLPGVVAVPDKELPVNQRAFGFMAAVGGITWILGILSIFVLPRDTEGSRSLGLAMVGMALAVAFVGVALAELGTREGSESSLRTGRFASVVVVFLAVMLPIAPWPVFLFSFFGFPIVSAALGVRGARNGRFPTWFAAVTVACGLAILSAIGVDAVAGRDGQLVMLAVVGVPGLCLATLALRGSSAPDEPVAQPG